MRTSVSNFYIESRCVSTPIPFLFQPSSFVSYELRSSLHSLRQYSAQIKFTIYLQQLINYFRAKKLLILPVNTSLFFFFFFLFHVECWYTVEKININQFWYKWLFKWFTCAMCCAVYSVFPIFVEMLNFFLFSSILFGCVWYIWMGEWFLCLWVTKMAKRK